MTRKEYTEYMKHLASQGWDWYNHSAHKVGANNTEKDSDIRDIENEYVVGFKQSRTSDREV